jgi:ethanolamine ammonia-lyase small subunit
MTPTPATWEGAWAGLRRFTTARIGLGAAGASLPTRARLDFQLAHARARDAVRRPLDEERLLAELAPVCETPPPLSSRAQTLDEFLARPDLGRRLDDDSASRLRSSEIKNLDLAVVLSPGLSSLAVERQAVPVLAALFPFLRTAGFRWGPLWLVRRGRVAVQDEIGEILGARQSLILIGERPGLLSPDSLGAYIVHHPKLGNTDAQRNCVSNIHSAGLSPRMAADKIAYLLIESRRAGLSGIRLKDNSNLVPGGDFREISGR